MTSKDLETKLHYLYQTLRQQTNQKWHRDLPFQDLLFDRWERAKHLGFGNKTNVYSSSLIFGDVKVGEETWIGPYTVLDGTGGLDIGNFCSISSGVHIYTHETVHWALSGGKQPYDYAPVKIGDCCFIGPQSIIRKGVIIGSHSVVGAMSFVNSSVESLTVVAGNPARQIGRVVQNARGDYEILPLDTPHRS